MTTGTQGLDGRVANPGYAGQPVYLGYASKRTWSGNDSSDPDPYVSAAALLRGGYESSLLDSMGKPFVIPHYRQRSCDPDVKRRRSENNYSAVYEESHGQYFYCYGYFGFGNVYATNEPGHDLPNVADSNWTDNDTLALINRLRSAMVGSSFDPATFLAQSHQALSMVALAAHRIDRSFLLLKKGRIKDAARTLCKGQRAQERVHRNYSRLSTKDLASAQLELSYGWLPLLKDAYESAEYIAHNTQLPMRASYRVRYRRKFVQTSSSPSIWGLPEQSCYVRGQLIARVHEDFAFSPTYLLGLDDPLSMVWERLPWSFVADWFCPIQTYLQDRAFARQVKGTFIQTITKKKHLPKVELLVGSPYSLVGPETYYYRSTAFERAVSTTLAVPLPKPRSLASVPSWRRALNATSLLVQRIF